YGVALRTATNVRRSNARRDARTKRAAVSAGRHSGPDDNPVDGGPAAPDELRLSELRGVLDEELARIPSELRGPLILCFLEGKTRDEAAAVLGCSLATLKSQLTRARELLRSRLTRRGITLAVAALGINLGAEASAAVQSEMSHRLAQAASQYVAGQSLPAGTVALHAVQIADGVLKTMKIKVLVLTTVAAGLILASGGLATWWAVNGWSDGEGHALA